LLLLPLFLFIHCHQARAKARQQLLQRCNDTER
jgi:hypothetical protein